MGQFTFVSHLGKSTIDLALVNLAGLDLVQDLQVILSSKSDNLPICLSRKSNTELRNTDLPRTLVKWKTCLSNERTLSICSSFITTLSQCEDFDLFEYSLDQITHILIKLGVIKISSNNLSSETNRGQTIKLKLAKET